MIPSSFGSCRKQAMYFVILLPPREEKHCYFTFTKLQFHFLHVIFYTLMLSLTYTIPLFFFSIFFLLFIMMRSKWCKKRTWLALWSIGIAHLASLYADQLALRWTLWKDQIGMRFRSRRWTYTIIHLRCKWQRIALHLKFTITCFQTWFLQFAKRSLSLQMW